MKNLFKSRKFLIIVGTIVFLIIVIPLVAKPIFSYIAEEKLNKDCPPENNDPLCVTRMRAMGHMLTSHNASNLKNLIQAIYWYKLAAEKGDAESMFHLGWTYHQFGTVGFNPQTSFEDVAKLLKEDKPIEKIDDIYDLSRKSFKNAAEKNFAPAMNNYGFMVRGTSMAANPQRQNDYFNWVIQSAEVGNPIAMLYLEFAYRNGSDVEKNQELADKWNNWNPNTTNPRDLIQPNCERTIVMGFDFPIQEMCSMLRELARKKETVKLTDYFQFKSLSGK